MVKRGTRRKGRESSALLKKCYYDVDACKVQRFSYTEAVVGGGGGGGAVVVVVGV